MPELVYTILVTLILYQIILHITRNWKQKSKGVQVNLYSLWERIKSGIAEFVQSRIFVLIIVFCITSAILVQRIFYLQIVKGQEYLDDYKLQIQKTKEIQGTRGNIYDRNGNLLAYNELAYSVTIEDNGSYDSIAQQNKVLNKTISSVIKMVESNGDTVINNFWNHFGQ